MTVKLYSYSAEENRIDKTSYLGTATTVSGDQIEGNQNMLTPSIVISSTTMPTYNYAYIASYGRYYFIDSVIWIADSTWRLNLRVDVLFSYKTEIGSQSGVVQYSNQGMALKYDPRLVYNGAPAHTTVTPSSTGYNPGEAWILMRVLYFDDNSLHTKHTATPDVNMRYYVFNKAAFADFMYQYAMMAEAGTTVDEERAVEIGKCIVDVSLVYYFTFANFTQTTDINFNTPAINWNEGGGYAGGISFALTQGKAYMLETGDQPTPYNISWWIAPTNYAQRKAQRTCYLPFVGSMSLDMDLMGLGLTAGTYAGVQLRYDFASNAYIMIPGSAALSSGATTFDKLYKNSMIRVANMFTFPFVVDSSYQNASSVMDQQLIGVMGNMLGGAVSAVATGGASIPASAISLGMGLANMGITGEKLEYQQASSLVARGSTNGGSIDSAFITFAGSPETVSYPGAFMEVLTNEPAANFSNYQAAYGLPDGQYRSLSGMTGYYQIAEIYLTGMGKATGSERREIISLLRSGVIA